MSKFKKILATVLVVLMVVPFAAFTASAAAPKAPEFKVTLVSETDKEVVVQFSLVNGKFNAIDFTIYTSSALTKCTNISSTKEFQNLVTDYIINKNDPFAMATNPDTKKISLASTIGFSEPVDMFNITFSKKSATPVKNTDIGIIVGSCAVADGNPGASGSGLTPVTDDVKITVEFKKFALNETAIAMNYKDTRTLDIDTNYSADELTWSSSNEKVAKVDENGNIVATGTGTATITVTSADGVVNETCEVTVSYTIVQWIIIIVLFGWIWY